jgi:Peptidase family M23
MKQRIILFLLNIALLSCQKDPITSLTDTDLENKEKSARLLIESMVVPKFGRPSATNYYFQVYDPSGTLALSVKLYEKATGNITYIPMTRIGNYWVLSTMIHSNGWYDWRYVYSFNKMNISSNVYTLCNSTVTFFSTAFSSIVWPFGADGSSFAKRNGWIGAEESGGCGNGWYENGHHYYGCSADDSYAEDWNKNCATPYADDGAIVYSPLDGKVVRVVIDSPQNHNGGYGNAIDIQQESSDGKLYVFRIAHLKYPPTLAVGKYVRAGSTKIGNIGMTGGTSSSPHGHCVLYDASTGCNSKAKFLFSAP